MHLRFAALRWMAPLFLLTGCIDDLPQQPPGVEPGTVFRRWTIDRLTADPAFDERLVSDRQTGGIVDVVQPLGNLIIMPAGVTPPAVAEVYSNETGETFWVSAQAPVASGPLLAPDSAIGSAVYLGQVLRFRKTAEDAALRFVISAAKLEALDGNGVAPSFDECPWARGALLEFAVDCAELMMSEIDVTYYGYDDPTRLDPVEAFYYASSTVRLFGWGSEWYADAHTSAVSVEALFGDSNFDVERSGGVDWQPVVRLNGPITVEIPLDSISMGEEFEVGMQVEARVQNRRQRESYIDAYFRDPASSEGLGVEFEGLTMLAPPDEIREDIVWSPPAATTCEANGPGGTIAFETDTYVEPEWPGGHASIMVTRTGGSAGVASVVLTTNDGSAMAGSDYGAVTTLVRFADGEEGRRMVAVPVHADTIMEDAETVMLSLGSPGGCATLGRASAELTILDDDQPPPATYTLGGTVTGLEGSGLQLRTTGFVVAITDNGPFAFPAEFSPGADYDITIDQQPTDPLQSCSVANGTGVIGDQDVTDVLVTCETPAGAGGLDPSFGTGGLVEARITPDSDDRFAAALALQADGKVLALGRSVLVRYHADGTLDTGFGSSGEVQVDFGADGVRLYGVTVQADGRILVAGGTIDNTNLPADEDIALARYNADGTLDASFGAGGVVTTDFIGRIDGGYDVLLQPDGSILVAGLAMVNAGGDFDFAVVRYTDAGALDTTFGAAGDGRASVNLAGNSDAAYAVALQSDGGIIVVGRAAPSGGSDPDIGIARFDASGILDPDFGTAGIVRVPTAEADWPLDAAVDASDRILVSGSYGFSAFVARYAPDGTPDATFGGGMVVFDELFRANGIALDDDGRILLAGEAGDDLAVPVVDGTAGCGHRHRPQPVVLRDDRVLLAAQDLQSEQGRPQHRHQHDDNCAQGAAAVNARAARCLESTGAFHLLPSSSAGVPLPSLTAVRRHRSARDASGGPACYSYCTPQAGQTQFGPRRRRPTWRSPWRTQPGSRPSSSCLRTRLFSSGVGAGTSNSRRCAQLRHSNQISPAPFSLVAMRTTSEKPPQPTGHGTMSPFR